MLGDNIIGFSNYSYSEKNDLTQENHSKGEPSNLARLKIRHPIMILGQIHLARLIYFRCSSVTFFLNLRLRHIEASNLRERVKRLELDFQIRQIRLESLYSPPQLLHPCLQTSPSKVLKTYNQTFHSFDLEDYEDWKNNSERLIYFADHMGQLS
jgi:hypothetical protein